MCLENNREILKDILDGPETEFKCFKVLEIQQEIQGVGCNLVSPYHSFKWEVGIVKAYFQTYTFEEHEKRFGSNIIDKVRSEPIVYHGIHVFKTKMQAYLLCSHFGSGWTNHNFGVIEVSGKKEHLLGANKNEMVFTQVEFKKQDILIPYQYKMVLS